MGTEGAGTQSGTDTTTTTTETTNTNVGLEAPANPGTTETTTTTDAPSSTTTTEGTETVVTYEPTGDAGLDVALAFVGKLGITADHPAMVATATGDFSLIKAHLATMGASATGWEQMVALAEQAHGRAAEAASAKATAVAKAVHAVAGGEEQWATVQAWASGEATPEERAELNAMFAAGPVQARAAAQMLVDLYAKAKGTVIEPASAITANGGASPGQSNNTGPLTAREYSDAVADLSRRVGAHNLNTHPEYAALGRRLRLN